MPAPYPEEFRRRAVALVIEEGRPAEPTARELGISPNTLRNWLRQHRIDVGQAEGLTTEERRELVKLRREVRVLKMGAGCSLAPRPSSLEENVLPRR